MNNIFREILKQFPYPNTQIISENPEDQKIVDRMSDLINYQAYEKKQLDESNCILKLDNEDRDTFLEALKDPGQPNKKFKEALKQYYEMREKKDE